MTCAAQSGYLDGLILSRSTLRCLVRLVRTYNPLCTYVREHVDFFFSFCLVRHWKASRSVQILSACWRGPIRIDQIELSITRFSSKVLYDAYLGFPPPVVFGL